MEDGYWPPLAVLELGFGQMSAGRKFWVGERESVVGAVRWETDQTLVLYWKSMLRWLPVHKPVEISLLMSPAAAAKTAVLSV